MKPIIEVRNIGKRYKITHERGKYIALRDVIANIAKSPFAFLADKAKSATGIKRKEEFWALRNVDFSINKGEVVGIIGHNGAGKSTLLKVLSQITPPTEGEIILRGTVGSLLEVGTGFHPELSGRENIFLNGAILGMHRREIAQKFDQIVEFAGIDKFLDTPVKFYSSGMYVRLAFSVAAHMEPDILLVDEVLAVGDAEFQKKCLGKMDEITRKDGRTILFVSHNLEAIRQLCPTAILLNKGQVDMIGSTEEVIEKYNTFITPHSNQDLRNTPNRRGNGKVKLTEFSVENESGQNITCIKTGEPAYLNFTYERAESEDVEDLDIGFSIHRDGMLLSKHYASQSGQTIHKPATKGSAKFKIESLPFGAGQYEIGARLITDGIESDWPKDMVGSLIIQGSDSKSPVILNGSWS